MPEVGQTISHYRIVEKIGQGGMGEVNQTKYWKPGREAALAIITVRV